jgi:hypothetical protein
VYFEMRLETVPVGRLVATERVGTLVEFWYWPEPDRRVLEEGIDGRILVQREWHPLAQLRERKLPGKNQSIPKHPNNCLVVRISVALFDHGLEVVQYHSVLRDFDVVGTSKV